MLSLWQMLRPEPLFSQNPEGVYNFLKMIVKAWSKKARNVIESILPPLEQFKKQQQMMVAQGVAGFLQNKAKEAVMGGQTEFLEDPGAMAQQLMQVISVLTKESATPPSKEEVAAREKQKKEAA